jgi:hypothetical protein
VSGAALEDAAGTAVTPSADNLIPKVMYTGTASVDSPLKLDFAATEAPMLETTTRNVHPCIIGGIRQVKVPNCHRSD